MKVMKSILCLLVFTLLVVPVLAIPANTTGTNPNRVFYATVNDTTTGYYPDSSGYGHNLYPVGTTSTDTTNKYFGAASLAVNTNGYATTADSSDFNLNGNWTIDVAFRKTANGADQAIIGQSDADGTAYWFLYFHTDDKPVFSSSSADTTIYGSVAITDTGWHQLRVNKSGTTGTMILDGTSVGTKTSMGTLPDSTGNLSLGRNGEYATGFYWSGNIDEAAIYKDEAIPGNVNSTCELLTNPTAGFSANVTSGDSPLSVQLIDNTIGNTPSAYSYRLTNVTGNNTELAPFSTSASPSVVLTAGNWSINQTVTNAFGSSSAYALINVFSVPGIDANFTASNTSGVQPLIVQFTDTSTTTDATIDAWAWDFGDGNISSSQNPSHTYEVPGTYTANLTITNTSLSLTSTKLQNITVYNRPPVADFNMNKTSGLPPLVVQFTDTSTGANISSWAWDFGEGNTSILQNPEHTFGSDGEYQVNLTVTNDGGISTKLQNITVYCAEFSGAPTIGTIPLLVTFTDLTTGGPTAWNWSFGDGTFSELQNPTHTYTTLGTYTVNLTSTIMGGDCTESKTNYIIAGITAAPTVAFTANRTEGASPFVVQFTDQSTQSPNAWNWSFGGDGYSDDQNPIHTFATPGTYWINLTATNPLGSGYLNKSAYITVKAAGTTIVDFSAVPTSGSPGVLVQFTDMSVVTNTSSLAYNWSFGDGTYSDTAGNVQHVYSYASVYDVNLTITNNVSKEFEFKQQYITISVSDKTTWYTPVQVPIRVFNEYGAPIVGILVSATPQNFTAPADWAETLIGVNPMVNISGTTVSGFTGTDGSWVAPVLQSQYYRFVFSNGTAGIHHEAYFYPSDPSYRIFITTGVTPNQTYTQITNSNLTFSQPNASYITMGMYYQDTSTLTDNVTFTVSDWKNGTVYFEQTFTSGYVTNPVTSSFTTPNIRGDEFVWKWVAYRSDGSVLSQANSLLSKGASGVMVDLGLPSVDWYQWISIFVIFLIGSMSSQRTKQFWAILIPVFASLFLWWGWFGIGIETVIGGLVIFCAVLGVIIYMKASLREKHGVGGPGSMILNIVFYLIILQACIGFVNGIGVWDVNTAVTDSPYKNVDITRDIPAIENAGGGMSDVAAVGLVLWDMGFSLMRVLWQIISAIAFIYPTLELMFPFLAGSQPAVNFLLLLQIGIWVAYALFAYKFVKGEIGTLEL